MFAIRTVDSGNDRSDCFLRLQGGIVLLHRYSERPSKQRFGSQIYIETVRGLKSDHLEMIYLMFEVEDSAHADSEEEKQLALDGFRSTGEMRRNL